MKPEYFTSFTHYTQGGKKVLGDKSKEGSDMIDFALNAVFFPP